MQIVSEQMKSWLMASAFYRKSPEKFKAHPNLPGYKKPLLVMYVSCLWEIPSFRNSPLSMTALRLTT